MTREAELRRELVGTAQRLLREGLVEGTSGNLSARLSDGRLLLTPTALAYDTMTPEDIVLCAADGRRIAGEREPTSECALHVAVLRAHPEIGAVIHSHAKFATMFALAREAVPCALEEFQIHVGGDVPVAAYHPSGSEALGEECAKWLGERSAVLMASHGLLAVGTDLARAHHVTALVERTAEIVWGARLLGRVESLPPSSLARFREHYLRSRGRS
jgi:L-fuculose-phosphate aldolase